ncbi:MAG TPA: ATP-binding protein [Bryobacteraceae bacterium]|nr:ATP-binding protein [Bryobacteraceae bacterium]
MDDSVTAAAKREVDIPDIFQALAEFSPMPMAAVEGAGHILRYVNPVFCLLTGRSREKLIGNPLCGIVPANDECLPLLDRVYATGQAETFTGQEDATAHPLYWSYAMWPVLVPEWGITAIILQVTETAHFHQQAAAMNQALMLASVRQHQLAEEAEILNEQLRRANEDLKQFAFAASHDLQEPLRMITSYSQLLLKGYRGQLEGEPQVCVDFITKGALHMRELLTDLLSYAEAGLDRGEAAGHVDLNEVLEKVQQNLESTIQESSAVVTAQHLPDVVGQQAHLVQLFQNLIGNAIKYRGEKSPHIHISAGQHNGAWRFAVADNGIGISPEHHKKVFGVFKRLHGPKIPGTGMGLAICQRVVERYGGTIWVESQLDQGSTFYFTLPATGRNR